MGKSAKKDGKKRKAESQHISDSDNNSVGNNSSLMSSIINGYNKVMYGAPSGTEPNTSTPLPTSKTAQDIEDIRQQLHANNVKLDTILVKLEKLDDIETRLQHIEGDVTDMKLRVTAVEQKTGDLENSVNFISGTLDDMQKDGGITRIKQRISNVEQRANNLEQSNTAISQSVNALEGKSVNVEQFHKIQKDISRHERTIESMCAGMDKLRRERKVLDDRVDYLQWRQMKNNLIFNGLEGESRYENVEEKLRCFIRQELGIDKHIEFANLHRFGRYTRDRPRPIVAKFLYTADRTMVLENSYKLRGSQWWITEQFPTAMEDKRRQLQPVARALRADGHRVKFVRDKMFVDGKLYDEDDYMYDQSDDRDGQHNAWEDMDFDNGPNGENAPQPTVDLR